jgi:2,4-dienoyl-CoA reductase-like NADH-dependent reductase (Old Yellow Enzyme family)
VAQIGHSGQDEGPTEISLGTAKPHALTTAEVAVIVEGFAQSIRRIKEAGWDGVELHAAHSYLLAAFISPYSNKRTDKYGGRTANRVRLIREIMDRARALAGPDFPIMIKLNSEETVKGGVTLEMFPEIGEEIEKTGVAAIDVSGSDCLKKEINRPERETYFYSGAAALDVKVPVIATGGNRSIDHLENVLGKNEVQFFGLSRPLIREPHLPVRWLEGRGSAAAECISCNGCFEDLSKGLYHCVQKA